MPQKKKGSRSDILLEALQAKKRMDLKEVTCLLGISDSTARRLFAELEKKGSLLRTYGGIQIPPEWNSDYRYEELLLHRAEQKKRIGAYAAALVEEGDILFLDSGTTLQYMAGALAIRFKEGMLRDVQIFTNSLANLKQLSPVCDVHLIGGLFRIKRQDFCGHLSEMVLRTIAFKKCFLGTDGISSQPGEGVMATDVYTAQLNEIVSRRSDKIYILADSTKFMRRSFIRYTPLTAPALFITDSELAAKDLDFFASLPVPVAIV